MNNLYEGWLKLSIFPQLNRLASCIAICSIMPRGEAKVAVGISNMSDFLNWDAYRLRPSIRCRLRSPLLQMALGLLRPIVLRFQEWVFPFHFMFLHLPSWDEYRTTFQFSCVNDMTWISASGRKVFPICLCIKCGSEPHRNLRLQAEFMTRFWKFIAYSVQKGFFWSRVFTKMLKYPSTRLYFDKENNNFDPCCFVFQLSNYKKTFMKFVKNKRIHSREINFSDLKSELNNFLKLMFFTDSILPTILNIFLVLLLLLDGPIGPNGMPFALHSSFSNSIELKV